MSARTGERLTRGRHRGPPGDRTPSNPPKSGVNGGLEPVQIELPPVDAAIFIEEVAPDGHALAAPMVRGGETLRGRPGGGKPLHSWGSADALDLVDHDRRLAIGTAKLLPQDPFAQPLVIVVRPCQRIIISPGQELVTNQVHPVDGVRFIGAVPFIGGTIKHILLGSLADGCAPAVGYRSCG